MEVIILTPEKVKGLYNLFIEHKEASEKLEELNTAIKKIIPTPKSIPIWQIVKFTSEVTNVPVELIRNCTRKKEVVISRQIAMTLALEYTDKSQRIIGNEIAKKDHATVNHAKKTIINLIKTNHHPFYNSGNKILEQITVKSWYDAVENKIKMFMK